ARRPAHVRPLGGVAAGDLVAHHLDGSGGRPDPGPALLVRDGPGEAGVLREKPVSGVHAVGPAAGDGVDDGLGVEVALGCGFTPEGVGLVGQAHVEGVPVEVGVHGDGPDAELATRTDDADGDLAPVGDQDLGEHAIWLLRCREGTPTPAWRAPAGSCAGSPAPARPTTTSWPRPETGRPTARFSSPTTRPGAGDG